MTLKGEWSGDSAYVAGDVVRYPNGLFYQCVRPCTGAPCADALYWNNLPSPLCECAKMIMDVAASIPNNISDEAITLKTDDGEYLVTVDDSGDTPELEVTEIEEEEATT